MEVDKEKSELICRRDTARDEYYKIKEGLRNNHGIKMLARKKIAKVDEEMKGLNDEINFINTVIAEILDVEDVDVESDELTGQEKEKWASILEKKAEYERQLKWLEDKRWLYNLALGKYKKEENALTKRERTMKKIYFDLRTTTKQDSSNKESDLDWEDVSVGVLLVGVVMLLVASGLIVLTYMGTFIEDFYIQISLFIGVLCVLSSATFNMFKKKK